TASTTAMLALGDALAIALMRAKGFKKEDFARLHPAGSLGRRLNLRARDIMHTGKENPVVGSRQTLKEALFMMTKTRRGATSIVDGKGRLSGYLTDGDLRRILDRGGTLALNAPVSWVMTKDPFSIKEDMMLDGVLEVFKTHNFDTIPVVDARSRPTGIIDERDLL
ncbi:MAG: CBS domain-containing protein, partial [Elusimicrobiota bacterium]